MIAIVFEIFHLQLMAKHDEMSTEFLMIHF